MEQEEALAKGLTRYFNGRPCMRGHLSERNSKSGQCLACVRTGPRPKRWGRAGDPEKAKVRAQEWRERNPEKLKFVMRANAVNMRDAPGRTTYADLMAIRADQNGLCRYCRCRLDMAEEHAEHILPISKGGSNWPWNIQFTCSDCNHLKGQSDPIEFERELAFCGEEWFYLFEPKQYRNSSLACEAV